MRYLVCSVLCITGCRGILSIEQRELEPPGSLAGQAGMSGSGATSGTATGAQSGSAGTGGLGWGCTAEGDGNAELRVGNLVPDTNAWDFCLHPEPESVACERPLSDSISAFGSQGFRYKQISRTVSWPAGRYRVKAVPAGDTCSSEGVELADAIDLVKGERSMLLVLQQEGEQPSVHLFPGDGSDLNQPIRFINAVVGAGPLDFGLSDSVDQGTQLVQVFASGVEWGKAPAEGLTSFGLVVNSDGFMTNPLASLNPFGVRLGNELLGVSLVPGSTSGPGSGAALEIIAVGRIGDPAFPTEAIAFRESIGVPLGAQTAFLDTSINYGQPLVVETVALNFRSPFTPLFDDKRRGGALAAVANSDAGVLCVQGLYKNSDVETLLALTQDKFPYFATVDTDRWTLPNDAAGLDGVVPEPPTVPACTVQEASSVMDCVAEHCSTIEGDANGYLTSMDCASSSCSLAYGVLAFGSFSKKNCFNCLIYNVSEFTIEETKNVCSSEPGTPVAFGGRNGVVLLSRFPIQEHSAWVFPKVLYQQIMLRAPVLLPHQVVVDVYCGVLAESNDKPLVSYTGDYSGGVTDAEGWNAHQALQAKQLRDWVVSSSGLRRAILAYQADIGQAYQANGEVLVDALGSAQAAAELYGAFDEAVDVDYVPSCTWCAENPLNSITGSPGYWTEHLLGHRIGVTSVGSSAITYSEATIPIEDSSGNLVIVPVTNQYGIRSTFEVPR